MTSKSKGGENAQMDEIMTEQVNARTAWFLAGAYAGGAKRKRIARDFDVSPDTAKGWLNGSGPGRRHFDEMVRKWGREFLNFVYPSTADARDRELVEIRSLKELIIRERENAPMVGRAGARLAPPEGAETLQTGAGAGNSAARHDRGSSAS